MAYVKQNKIVTYVNNNKIPIMHSKAYNFNFLKSLYRVLGYGEEGSIYTDQTAFLCALAWLVSHTSLAPMACHLDKN